MEAHASVNKNMKKGELIAMWHANGLRSEVTCIARSPIEDTFAVGYHDGSIRLWSDYEKNVIVTFNGHRKAVTSLCFDNKGTRLASGSQDTEIIIWDVISETGMFRCVCALICSSSFDLRQPKTDCVDTETR